MTAKLDDLHHLRVLVKVAQAIRRHDGYARLGHPARLDAAENLADLFRAVLVVGAHVAAQLVQPVKVLATNLAHVGAANVVDATMLGQVGRLAKLFAANVTLQGLGAGMRALVHC